MAEKGLIDFFIAEAEEHMGILEKGFLELENNPEDLSGIHELFRAAHTLKGSAALVKLHVTSEVAHTMEDLLEEIRDQKVKVTKDIIDWLLHSLDAIKFLIAEVVRGNPEKKEIEREIKESLQALMQESTLPELEEKEEGFVEKRELGRRKEDIETLSTYIRVRVENIEKMMNLVGELTVLRNYITAESEKIFKMKDEVDYAGKRLLKEIDSFSTRYAYSIPDRVSYVDELLEEFRELEFDRYDELNMFVRKLQEITEDITEALKGITGFFDQFYIHVKSLDRLNTEFRDLISQSRMVEIGRLFQRFTRTIRDLSHSSGKKVKFVVSGTDTKIDRLLYDRLFDPLLHLVRNAISHGLEPPEERLQKGKPEEGRIAMTARREGNSVVIDVKDDGRGIDLKKVYRRALELGFIKKGQRVSKGQLLGFMFRPGFSTADRGGALSGRGVGLDVVREAVSEMNGTINVATREGKGTIFRIKLPLTLIIVNVVRFRAGGIEFVVPSALIQELIEFTEDSYDAGNKTVRIRDKVLEVKDICELLCLNTHREGGRHRAIVFNLMPGKELALIVDEVTGQEDTVIKPFGRFLEGLKYYSGVSISADGRLMPVINPATLLELTERPRETKVLRPDRRDGRTVLVVDDSLSVRKFVSATLAQRGYTVLTASNGLEALNIIDEHPVDLIITDLEMPVMHGYEFLRELQRRGLSAIIPSVVLTSRGSKKHREKAMVLGAQDYLIKPFEEITLLQTVRKHLKSPTPA